MNISNFEIGEDLTELRAGDNEASFARFLIIVQNLKYIVNLFPSQSFCVVVFYK